MHTVVRGRIARLHFARAVHRLKQVEEVPVVLVPLVGCADSGRVLYRERVRVREELDEFHADDAVLDLLTEDRHRDAALPQPRVPPARKGLQLLLVLLLAENQCPGGRPPLRLTRVFPHSVFRVSYLRHDCNQRMQPN